MKLISVPATKTTPETFDVIDGLDHWPIDHPTASIFSYVTGPAINVKTQANRTKILAVLDARKAATGQ